MSLALSDLETEVALALHDSSNLTFHTDTIDLIINEALVEIGRICPQKFVQDITSSSDVKLDGTALGFPIQDADPRCEIMGVEVWDMSVTPAQFKGRLRPLASEYVNDSSAGWRFWAGYLYITNAQLQNINPALNTTLFLRVLGYAPFAKLTSGHTGPTPSVDLTPDQEMGLVDYARVVGLKMLLSSRELYSQWQTASRNTDVTPAALMGMYNAANVAWRQRSRALFELREAP